MLSIWASLPHALCYYLFAIIVLSCSSTKVLNPKILFVFLDSFRESIRCVERWPEHRDRISWGVGSPLDLQMQDSSWSKGRVTPRVVGSGFRNAWSLRFLYDREDANVVTTFRIARQRCISLPVDTYIAVTFLYSRQTVDECLFRFMPFCSTVLGSTWVYISSDPDDLKNELFLCCVDAVYADEMQYEIHSKECQLEMGLPRRVCINQINYGSVSLINRRRRHGRRHRDKTGLYLWRRRGYWWRVCLSVPLFPPARNGIMPFSLSIIGSSELREQKWAEREGILAAHRPLVMAHFRVWGPNPPDVLNAITTITRSLSVPRRRPTPETQQRRYAPYSVCGDPYLIVDVFIRGTDWNWPSSLNPRSSLDLIILRACLDNPRWECGPALN